MNYRHAYHAGNFADVLKHAVLALVIDYLKRKDAPFRVIDTHAGPGVYDLRAPEAQRTGEWRDGIGRLIGPAAAELPTDIERLLAPYLSAIRAESGHKEFATYPGSPAIARHLIRRQDRLIVNELHPEDQAQLALLFGHDAQTTVLAVDGWAALKSVLPPRERRGVVLIDPPFEQAGEFERLLDGLGAARRRFATGAVLLWYPIKDMAAVARFHRALVAAETPRLLACDLFVRRPEPGGPLAGTGLVIHNPPYTLEAELQTLMPVLVDRLSQGKGAAFNLRVLDSPSRIRDRSTARRRT